MKDSKLFFILRCDPGRLTMMRVTLPGPCGGRPDKASWIHGAGIAPDIRGPAEEPAGGA